MVLVVDDNSELLALLSSSLEDAGYVVQTAQRGRAALDLVKKEKPDVAIIDILLPDVMGFEVGQALRRANVPFVFMSGVHKGGKASANAVGQYGAAGYFEKPFERKAMLALLEKLAKGEDWSETFTQTGVVFTPAALRRSRSPSGMIPPPKITTSVTPFAVSASITAGKSVL
mgnify:CR=1 FL=1